jgi:serine/threonine protein kinase
MIAHATPLLTSLKGEPMPLAIGTRLGPYEIVAPLGSGGMGEVYRARDTRLDRSVAIKTLSEPLAADPVFLERFDREARSISALSHPHICSLFDVGEVPDPNRRASSLEPPGRIRFLVMEYLEGETLSRRLEKGALPVAQALQYAIQVADALDKAHRVGIVHRDLKPGNIMLTTGGAKLLDFGLAKSGTGIAGEAGRPGAVLAHGLSPGNPTALPTTPATLTAHGTILGTFQYMAPEQIEGQEADARTDIFAFGGVVHEMVTGKRAFEGKTQASLLGAILKDTPPSIASLQPSASPALTRLVSTCLAKDPSDRWQNAGDLVRELKWIAEDSSKTTAVAASLTAHPVDRGRGPSVWKVATGVLALLFVIALVPSVLYFRRPTSEPILTRLDVVTPSMAVDPTDFVLSPDGRQLAFVARSEGTTKLWIRSFDQTTAQSLAGTEDSSYPFWAPDGRALGFFAGGKLKRIDLPGGAPQVLAEAPIGRGGAWGRDGLILFSPSTTTGLVRVPATGGEPIIVTRLAAGQGSHRWPQFLPDGRRFIFLASLGRAETRGVFVGSVDGGEPTRVLEAATAAIYAPPDTLLVVRQGVLMALRFDQTHSRVTGDPIPVAQGVGLNEPLQHSAFSASGEVLAHRTGGVSPRQLMWIDRTGKVIGTVGRPDEAALTYPALSPDGQRVAVTRVVDQNNDVWLIEVGRGISSRFTFDTSLELAPLWSPDGRRLVFRSGRNGVYDLFEKNASGAGDEQPLLVTPETKVPQDWSPDGRLLLYVTQNPKTGSDLWALPMVGERKPFPVLVTSFEEADAQFSPDGRWLAYESNQSGRAEIYVRPFQGPAGPSQISSAGGTQPRWRRDGKELFYISPDGHLMATPLALASDGQTLQVGAPIALFTARLATGGNIIASGGLQRPQYAVAPDGRFLMNVAVDEPVMQPITIVQNWNVLLKK